MASSYPEIYNIGHRAVEDLLNGPVLVEEKIDGSQISFGKDTDGNLFARSKNKDLNLIAPDGMFAQAIAVINAVSAKIEPGMTVRGEYLQKPKHNTLKYDRIPQNNIIVFDIEHGEQKFFDYGTKKMLAADMGLECVPLLYSGMVQSLDQITSLLQTESILGGQKIEGVVIKPALYDLYGRDKKVLMGKYVSEAFKEIHRTTWKEENPTKSDVIQAIAANLATEARWRKAVQHLREDGKITDEPKDIGLLIPAIQEDILKECSELIREHLFSWAWPQLKRMAIRGAAEWYKTELAKNQFDGNEAA